MLTLFDLDGTLIASYMARPDRDFDVVEFLPGALEMVAEARQRGNVALITNQGGVAYDLVSREQVATKLERVAVALGFDGADVFDGESLPHIRHNHLACFVSYDKTGSRHKPAPTMLHEAMAVFGDVDVVMVGDRDEDEHAAMAAGVKFVRV